MLNSIKANAQQSQETEKTNLIEAALFLDFNYDGKPIDIILPDGTRAKLLVSNSGKTYFQVASSD